MLFISTFGLEYVGNLSTHLTQLKKLSLTQLSACCVARCKKWHYTAYDDFLARKMQHFAKYLSNELTLKLLIDVYRLQSKIFRHFNLKFSVNCRII